jgi:hypothetical protein
MNTMRAASMLLGTLTCILLFTGCIKDPVPVPLSTNPFDPDYEGPPLVELDSSSTVVYYQDFVPVDTVLRFHFKFRRDLFPSPTSFIPVVTDLTTGTVDPGNELVSATSWTYERSGVQPGQSYCLDVQLRVLFSDTRKWRACATAEL